MIIYTSIYIEYVFIAMIMKWFVALIRKQQFLKDGLVVTSPGRLLCKNIIHVRARNSLDGWAESIKKCLKETERLGLNSVAFPALGTGEPFLLLEDFILFNYAITRLNNIIIFGTQTIPFCTWLILLPVIWFFYLDLF